MKKAKLNFIDKAVAFLNPQGAVDRLVARQKLTKFEYDAVKYTRERKGPSSLSGAEDYRSNYDRVELMKRARDLAENVGLVRSLLLKFAGHVAGAISYQARTSSPQVNSDIEAFWAEWWDKCDISTRHTGGTLMQVAVMSMLRDGDFLFVLVRDADGNLKVQGIEADRLGDPFKVYTSLELIGGIHIDRATGAPTAYDIYNRSIGDFYTYQATISASQAFHLFDPLRIDQYRGVSAFHTAINDATDIYELTSFEKMAAKTASAQSAIVKRNNNNAADLSTLSTDDDLSGNAIKLETIESGKISYLEPGEDIIFPNGPARPSGAFMEFHKVLMRNICLGLGIPYSFAVDPSAMSGPTARLEMQQAGRTFRRYQNLLNDKVLRPLKNIVIADAVSRGLISRDAGTQSTRGIFNFGANVSIDLGRESQANIAEFRAGLITASSVYAEKGQDFESAMRQRAIEAKAIQDLAKEYGVPAETISDISQPQIGQQVQQGAQEQGGEQTNPETLQPVSDISLNGAQVASLINIINAVAAGALSKEGAVSVITAAFPTISREQAISIVGGVQEGNIIPTTKEERAATQQDQGDQDSGGESAPKEPTTPQAPSGEAQKKSNLEILEDLNADELKMLIAGMMGGIELGKYDGIDFTPPEGAREAAKRALDVREKKPASQKGMTPVGIARARDLINGVKFSPDTVRRMKAFFDRHEVDKKGSTWDEQGKGWQAWNGWGGDAGYAWARKVVGQMEAKEKELSQKPQDIIEFLRGRDCGQTEGGTFGPGNECAVGYGRPAKDGGYDPIRPGGKWPAGYKVGEGQTGEDRGKPSKKEEENKETPTKAKPQEEAIPKYKWSGKGKRPNPGVKIFNGQNNELDWSDFRKKQIEEDRDAIWKAGEVGIKGENLDFDNWVDGVRNDRTAWQITNDYRGRYYTDINQKPDSDVGKKLVSIMNKQKSFDQKGTMYRGMAFASDEESQKFVSQFSGGGKLNRTLTSFTTDKSVADQFSGGGTSQVTMRLVKSKNLKRLSGLDRGSKGEKEYVLTYGAKLRTVGSRVEKRKTLGGREFNEYVIDVEEY